MHLPANPHRTVTLSTLLPLTPSERQHHYHPSTHLVPHEVIYDGEYRITLHERSMGGYGSAFGAPRTTFHEIHIERACTGFVYLHVSWDDAGPAFCAPNQGAVFGTVTNPWLRDARAALDAAKAYLDTPAGQFSGSYAAQKRAEVQGRALIRLERHHWAWRRRTCHEQRAARRSVAAVPPAHPAPATAP